MRFIWDERKRRSNLKVHGLDFVDVERVFSGLTATFEDDRFFYGEVRFVTLGFLDGVPVSIVHTESADSVRPISFRRATSNEEIILFNSLENELPRSPEDEEFGRKAHRRTSRARRKPHSPSNRSKRPKARPT